MARSRYDAMQKSTTVQDEETGVYYYDPLTFPIESFSYNYPTVKYALTELDIQRIDLAMATYYGVPNFDDIVLWLSDVPLIYDAEIGTEIEFPRRPDIESFYTGFSL